jgi:hypothetical protein
VAHYADASNVPDVVAGRVRLARDNVAGNTADQILALTTGIQQTPQPDGSTVYTGTIPESAVDPDTLIKPSDDVLMTTILSPSRRPRRPRRPRRSSDAAPVGRRKRRNVQEVELTRGDKLKFTYSDLGQYAADHRACERH